MPIKQFFSELRQLIALPVLGLGMKYQEVLRDQAGPRGTEPNDFFHDGLFKTVLTLSEETCLTELPG